MKILLHICCSNCATYPFKILKEEDHDFAGFWFNPNIHPLEEYSLRLDSLKSLADRWLMDVFYVEEYMPDEYFKMFGISTSNGLNSFNDSFVESPERCKACYKLRLEKTAEEAGKRGFEAFSTTLLISPYQDFDQIVTLGRELARNYGVAFFQKDFRPYFRDSGVLSRDLGLYRQKYCGCIFSRKERESRERNSRFQIAKTK